MQYALIFYDLQLILAPMGCGILTRADELYGEPVLPHFRLPLVTLFEEIEAVEPPQQTVS